MRTSLVFLLGAVTCARCLGGEAEDLLPFKQVRLGMSSDELTNVMPNLKFLFVEGDEHGQPVSGIGMKGIVSNEFWDTLGVVVEHRKVTAYGYARLTPPKQPDKWVIRLAATMVRVFGADYAIEATEFTHHEGEPPRYWPLIIWKRDDCQLAYGFTAPEDCHNVDEFHCNLQVVPKNHPLEKLSDVVVNEETKRRTPALGKRIRALINEELQQRDESGREGQFRKHGVGDERPGVRSNYSIIGLTVGRDAPAAIGPGGGRQPAEPGKRDRA
jgi:hypothetical protein